MATALDECAAQADGGIRVEPLEDLPEGAVGYHSYTPGTPGGERGSFVIASTDEGRS